jgi:hypothetical protein
MSLYIRLIPGVKIRIGRRGRTRVGIGPRWLRLWGARLLRDTDARSHLSDETETQARLG